MFDAGRRPDTVAMEMGIAVGLINKWWLQRDDIRTQFERYCAAQENQERLWQRANGAGSSKDALEEEVNNGDMDDKDEDFTPEDGCSKIDHDSDDGRKSASKRKRKKEEHSPYKRRRRVELPTIKEAASGSKTTADSMSETAKSLPERASKQSKSLPSNPESESQKILVKKSP